MEDMATFIKKGIKMNSHCKALPSESNLFSAQYDQR